MTVGVRTARVEEAPVVIGILGLAFSGDPAMRWTFSRVDDYLHWQPAFMMAMAGRAFTEGTAFVTEDLGAAALWLGPGVAADGEVLGAMFERAIPPERSEVGMQVGELMGRFHPEAAHWYLPLIGVDPSRQGRGLGSALLKHALRLCDQTGLPAYLESSNPKNVPLYERHGFEAVGEIRPGDFPGLTPMLRPART